MSTHTEHHHHDYLVSRFDGSYWPAILAGAAVVALAALAWAI